MSLRCQSASPRRTRARIRRGTDSDSDGKSCGRSALRAVELADCVSRAARTEQWELEAPFSWADSFKTILKTGDRSASALERIALVWDRPVELDGDDADSDSGERRKARRVRDRLREAAQRPQEDRPGGAFNEAEAVFPYATLFEEGYWSQEGVPNLQRTEGDDAEAYKELVAFVRANRERRLGKPPGAPA